MFVYSGVRKQDLIRELQQCKDLRNLLEDNTDDTDDANAGKTLMNSLTYICNVH